MAAPYVALPGISRTKMMAARRHRRAMRRWTFVAVTMAAAATLAISLWLVLPHPTAVYVNGYALDEDGVLFQDPRVLTAKHRLEAVQQRARVALLRLERAHKRGDLWKAWGIHWKQVAIRNAQKLKAARHQLDSLLLTLPGGGGSAGYLGSGTLGYAWASALAARFGMRVISEYRPGSLTASGGQSNHAIWGKAADIAGSATQMAVLYRYAVGSLSQWCEIIYRHDGWSGGSHFYYAAADHFNHVHLARS